MKTYNLLKVKNRSYYYRIYGNKYGRKIEVTDDKGPLHKPSVITDIYVFNKNKIKNVVIQIIKKMREYLEYEG
jgi:hypothetical protein